jgi:murein DD-endopeptidase MepM/ murein hydrolase activator NlpD
MPADGEEGRATRDREKTVSNQHFTVLIVPDTQGPAKRLRVEKRLVYGLCLIGLFVVAAIGAVFVHYSYVVGEVFEARQLRDENSQLKGRMAELTGKLDVVQNRLDEVRRLDEKLRSMTALADAARGLAVGPLSPAVGAGGTGTDGFDPFAVELGEERGNSAWVRDALYNSRIEGLALEVSRQYSSLSELVDYFSGQEALLSATPSIWPTRGYPTSDFGVRDDPYTGEKTMHLGVDLAGKTGTPVVAPASGVVIFAGDRGAYGTMIAIEHGRGLVTHYGHLQRTLVKVGETVERGQHIGALGNTGRSTGPHLHYEIRVNGVPVNPRRFVLHDQ